MTIWVSRLLALVATASRSKMMSSSPACTSSPTLTLTVKPSPFMCTVSNPIWVNTSRPSADRMVRAWAAGWMWMTSPSQGATRVLLSGSIEIPSPTIFWAKTGSGTCSIGTSTPVMGATSVTRATGGADMWVDMVCPLARSVIRDGETFEP